MFAKTIHPELHLPAWPEQAVPRVLLLQMDTVVPRRMASLRAKFTAVIMSLV
ncbi:MAG: hypothetical protein WDO56_24925 [Gammaproteobacteria bacterium]